MTTVSLEQKIELLRRPDTYPESPLQVDAIETHMSWVFLTGRSAYKLKKPIRWDRLDFTTAELRRINCEEEVRLNRRLARAVYHGTIALTLAEDGTLALDGTGEPVDWLVHMRRLPDSRMLDWILSRRRVEESEIRPAALLLAEFFASARAVPISTPELCTRFEKGIRQDREELSRPEFGLPQPRIEAIADAQLSFLRDHAALFEERIRQDRIVEGHGDLRPEHVCLTPEPVVIDCLEFCAELRELDPIDELGFLALECERLGQPDVGRCFLETYLEHSGDRPPESLLEFYRRYRILRRARLAAWHLTDPETRDPERFAARAKRYLELAHLPSD